ncbi:Hypothetical protein zj316_0989 [Lactiplantibacillus plantarum ZJ316]|nr:Hypothetical protein zj316_0989 [Lactiplantibacillus plantarum ZJ316]
MQIQTSSNVEGVFQIILIGSDKVVGFIKNTSYHTLISFAGIF